MAADAVQAVGALQAGDALLLEHVPTGHSSTLLVEPVRDGSVCMLAQPARPYHRLHRSDQKRALSWRQTAGNAAALWRLEPDGGGLHIRAARTKAETGPTLSLGLDVAGEWVLLEESGGAACRSAPVWRLREAASATSEVSAAATPAASFSRDGYCLLPRLVPAERVARALRYLNHHLGSADLASDLEPNGLGMAFIEATSGPDGPSGVVKLGGGHRCTCSLAQAAPLLELLGERERAALAAALTRDAAGAAGGGDGAAGEGAAPRVSPMFGCQVALRFPLAPFASGVADGAAALPSLLSTVGLDWHSDAAKYNDKKHFDFVVGIFLSSVAEPSDGALWVRPGSHATERSARQSGALHGALLSHDAASASGVIDAEAGRGGGGSVRPILATAGSAIVFDKDLLHAGGPNLSADIRYALYYRLRWEQTGVSSQ